MAKKDVGEMKRAAGFQNEFWNAYVDELIKLGVAAERLFGLDTEGLHKVAKAAAIATVANDGGDLYYRFSVNHRKTVEELVEAGQYDGYVNPDITSEHFPPGGLGMVDTLARLVHLDRSASIDEVLAELDRQGFRPATMHELLSFGAIYPDVQREFPIVALGSVWTDPNGDRHCGYLWVDSDGRDLNLGWLDSVWDSYYRFLAVRK